MSSKKKASTARSGKAPRLKKTTKNSKKRQKAAHKKPSKPVKAEKPSKKPSKKKRGAKRPSRRLSKVELLQAQVASLTRRLRRYEKQRFAGPIREGEKRKKPPKVELDAIRSKLKLFLEGIKRNLELTDHASKYRSHENTDFSIDAELRVPLETEDGWNEVEPTFLDIEEAGDWNSLSEFWLLIGLVSSAEEVTGSPTIDKRPNRAWTNPVRGNRAGAAFFTARQTIVHKLEQWGADVTMIIIRLHWSPYNDRPSRPRH